MSIWTIISKVRLEAFMWVSSRLKNSAIIILQESHYFTKKVKKHRHQSENIVDVTTLRLTLV